MEAGSWNITAGYLKKGAGMAREAAEQFTFDRIDSVLNRKIEGDAVSSLEEVESIAKFDPENSHSNKKELIRTRVLEGEYDAVQIGGTDNIKPEDYRKWVNAAVEIGDELGIEVIAEPSEPEHVMGNSQPHKLIGEPDSFTVPYPTNTENGGVKGEEHREFLKKLNRHIEDRGADELLTSIVDFKIKSEAPETVPEETVEKFISTASVGKRYVSWLEEKEGYHASKKKLKNYFWSQYLQEDYFVLNPEANVAEESGSERWLQGKNTEDLIEDVRSEIELAARTRDNNLFYIEGSGAQVPFELIKAADLKRVEEDLDIKLVYGGGIQQKNDRGPDTIEELEYDISPGGNYSDIDGYCIEEMTGGEQEEMVLKAGADA